MRRLLPALLLCGSPLAAQAPRPPALDAIRATDIRRDVDFLAGDYFRGREAGSPDELRASMWIATQLQAIGRKPAGEDGTFFQWFPMRRIRLADNSRIAIDGTALTLWKDATVSTTTDASLDLPILFVGAGLDSDLAGKDLTGKAVAAILGPAVNAPERTGGVPIARRESFALTTQARSLIEQGAAAVIFVADSDASAAMPFLIASHSRGLYALGSNEPVNPRARVVAPVILVNLRALDKVRSGSRLELRLSTESFTYPSVNIPGVIPGTGPVLKNEYVLFSLHQDHDGVRGAIDGDSIYNGADDNTSVTAGLFAIARAWAKKPGKRSARFIWHGGEERGLLGSRWHAEHSLVPEGWYFRSDHLPYARAGVPALMDSTLLHADYHTPRDEPSRIDAQKLARMAQWMYATGWYVSETRERPGADPGFKPER